MNVGLIVVTEGEPAAQLLNHILHGRLGIDPTEHPLMITEPAWNTQKAREMLTEMVFEGEKMPALYFGSQGVTSAYVLICVSSCVQWDS